MTNHASARFWKCYRELPERTRKVADQAFAIFDIDPQHPSLHFKKVGKLWSARVDQHYRALAIDTEDGLLWIWIGNHHEYERLIRAT